MKKTCKKIASLFLALTLIFVSTQGVLAKQNPEVTRGAMCPCDGMMTSHYVYGAWKTIAIIDCSHGNGETDSVQERTKTEEVRCNSCGSGYDNQSKETRIVHNPL